MRTGATVVDTTTAGLARIGKQSSKLTLTCCERWEAVLRAVMGEEVDAICGASYGERSEDRTNCRNGYRIRAWDARTGMIDLTVPKLRDGSYFSEWLLESRRRAERAFVQVVCEPYAAEASGSPCASKSR